MILSICMLFSFPLSDGVVCVCLGLTAEQRDQKILVGMPRVTLVQLGRNGECVNKSFCISSGLLQNVDAFGCQVARHVVAGERSLLTDKERGLPVTDAHTRSAGKTNMLFYLYVPITALMVLSLGASGGCPPISNSQTSSLKMCFRFLHLVSSLSYIHSLHYSFFPSSSILSLFIFHPPTSV